MENPPRARLRGRDSRAADALLAAASILLVLLGIEGFLAFGEPRAPDARKRMVVGPDHFGHCYSSDPARYWPLSLRERPEDRAFLEERVPAALVEQLVAETPHCILYDVSRRGRGFSPERSAQAVLVGDSFCFGEGLREEDTLGYLLGTRFTEYNVRNLGWPGTDIEHASAVVARALRELPDLRSVVYVLNLNDIPDAHNPLARRPRVHDLENIRWDAGAAPARGPKSILDHSALFRLARRTWLLRRESAETTRDYLDMYLHPARNAGYAQMRRLLRTMRDEAAAANVELVVVVYPLLHKDLLGRYPFRGIHDLLGKDCRDLGIRFVDAYPAFDGFRNLKPFTVHEIDLHPNGRANRLVADYLVRGDKLGWARPARRPRR